MANQEAVQKCIADGGADWLVEDIEELAPTTNWESLATWYGNNCEEWVGHLENIEKIVELYNSYEKDSIEVSDLEGRPQTLDFTLTTPFGTDMAGDTSRALELGGFLPNKHAEKLTTAQTQLEYLWEEFNGKNDESLAMRTASTDSAYYNMDARVSNWLDKLIDDDADRAEKRRQIQRQNAIAKGRYDDASSPDFSHMVFKEQCFLLTKIFDIVDHKKDVIESSDVGMAEFAVPKRIPYNGTSDGSNASIQIEGDPFNFINGLTQDPMLGALFNMETKEISSLQPQIRLFKIIQDKQTGKEVQQEYMFDAYATKSDVSSVFANKARRGFGVGIKDFSFTYDGNNPFAAKKSIKAKLTIFANSFGELLVDRGGYMYADLALKTGGATNDSGACTEAEGAERAAISQINNNLYKLDFRLKAVVGWAMPSGDTSLFTSTSASEQKTIIDALKESFITLNLVPTLHEFNIDDQGRVNFVVNFLAYIDDFFDQPQFNIFYSPEATRMRMTRKLLYDVLQKECSSEKFAEVKKADAARGAVAAEKSLSMKALISRMCDANKIKYITMSYDDLKRFASEGPFFTSEEETDPVYIQDASDSLSAFDGRLEAEYIEKLSVGGGASLGTKAQASRRETLNIILEANNPNINHVGFFYASDLMDIILESIDEYLKDYSYNGTAWSDLIEEIVTAEPEYVKYTETIVCQLKQEKESFMRFQQSFKKFRLVLGPLEIVDSRGNGTSQFISLGDIPISVKYFVEWLNTKMTKKEESTYFLGRFLQDFFNNLINNFLNDDGCFAGFNVKQKILLNNAAVTSYPTNPPKDEMTALLLKSSNKNRLFTKNLGGRPLLNISGTRGDVTTFGPVGNEINYLIFSAGRTRRAGAMAGNRIADEEAGIFHYVLGQPRGIVKNINLSRATPKYLKEVRFVQDGFDGLQQLREQYNATIECYSNVRVLPGTYIFVDPRGWAPDTNLEPCNLKNLAEYGVGGYFMVYRAESTFGPGEANTTLHAQWVQEIESTDSRCPLSVPRDIGAGEDSLICEDIVSGRIPRQEDEAATAEAAAEATIEAQNLALEEREDDVGFWEGIDRTIFGINAPGGGLCNGKPCPPRS